MLLKTDARQLAHILAGLRLLEAHAYDGYHEEQNFTEILAGHERLDHEQIDQLCEDLNGGDLVVDEKDLSEIEKQWSSRCRFFSLDGPDRIYRQEDFFSGAMSARVAAGMEHGAAMPPGWVITIMRGEQIGD